MARGRLILIEGLDRSGKSSQAKILEERLRKSKLVKFPERSTKVGAIINEYLTRSDFQLSDQTAHLLFSANRWELSSQILEWLHEGFFVVLDRYIYSGVAYSLAKLRAGLSTSPEMCDVNWLFGPDRGLPEPDATIFLTLPIEVLCERKGWGEERYEDKVFQQMVKECYIQLLHSRHDPSIFIVDVESLGIDEVATKIWEILQEKKLNVHTKDPIKSF